MSVHPVASDEVTSGSAPHGGGSSKGSRAIDVVMVHGVGDAKPGAILRELCTGLQKSGTRVRVREEQLLLGQATYPVLVPEVLALAGRPVHDITEVNWADVKRPSTGKLGVIGHGLMLVFALRNLSLERESNPSSFARTAAFAYWWAVESITIWVALIVMLLMVLVSSDQPGWIAALIGAGEALALAGVAWWLSEPERWFRQTKRPRYCVGYGWAAAYLAVSLVTAFGADGLKEAVVQASACLYEASQTVAIGLLLLSMGAAILRGGGDVSRRAARGGYLWLPFIIITSMLVAGWLSGLLSASRWQGYHLWVRAFGPSLTYNLQKAEEIMMAAQVVIFFGAALIGVATYFFKGIRQRFAGIAPVVAFASLAALYFDPRMAWVVIPFVGVCLWLVKEKVWQFPADAGPAAHHTLMLFLLAGPVFLSLAIIGILVFAFDGQQATANVQMIKTYALSAVRLSALLPSMLPVMRNISDVVGDVLFHIQPAGSEVGSSGQTVPRVEALLDYLGDRPGGRETVILAHSQGTVIVWEALRRSEKFSGQFITVGSPLKTLYTRFLADRFDQPVKTHGWANLYREGDYIGGSVSSANPDRDIGAGDHVGYWSDPKVIAEIEKVLSAREAPAA